MKQRFVQQQVPTKGLVAYFKLWGKPTSATTVFGYGSGGFVGTLTGTDIAAVYPGFLLNGTDDYIDVGTGPSSVNTVLMWTKPDSVEDPSWPIDLNGTDFLKIENETLSAAGFAGGTAVLYVDGVASTDVVGIVWHLVGITDTVAKDASDLDIGKETANFASGTIGETMLFDRVLSAADIKSVFELTRERYSV